MELRSAVRRFFRSWLTHWLTSVALTVLVVASLYLLSDRALFRFLDHAGGDALVRAYGGGPVPKSLSVTLVDLGPEPTIDALTEVLNKIAGSQARSVGLDVRIPNLPLGPDGKPDPKKKNDLRQALGALGALTMPIPVAMPIASQEFADAIGDLPEIREASAELVRDDDGVVRATQERICAHRYDGRATLPTLAAAVFRYDQPSKRSNGCEKSEDARPILFAPPEVAGKGISPPFQDRTGIYILSKEMLADHDPLLNGAYVIVGDIGAGSTTDYFMTPVGLYPGSLIHAEAVRTLASVDKPLGTRILRELLLVFLELSVGATSGALFAVLLVIRGDRHETDRPRAAVGIGSCALFTALLVLRGDRHEIDSPRAAFIRLAWGLGGIVFMALALFLIGVLWTWATPLVQSGVVIGAAGAVFGAMLETLVHVGDDVVGPLHWTMKRVVNWILASAAIVLFCAAPLAARAEECAYYVATLTPNDEVDSIPPHAHPKDDPWRPFERVHVKANKVVISPKEGSPGKPFDFAPERGDGVLVLPPCAPDVGFGAAWRSFWEALNPREATTATGATLLYRGIDDGEQAGQQGPLRELAGLAPAVGVVAGTEGLALAWAGGAPPFSVAFEDAGDGSLIGRAHTERRYLWLPGWRPPANPFAVTIQDSLGAVLRHRLRLLPTAPVADGGVAQAIQLYETAPEYRMEAFRRLAARSEAGDDLAERAVGLIRVAGGAP